MNFNNPVLDLLHFSWSSKNGSTCHKTTVHKLPSEADLHILLDELINGKPRNEQHSWAWNSASDEKIREFSFSEAVVLITVSLN